MGINGIENLFGDDFPEHKDHDDTDVEMVIRTHTGDGPGFVSTTGEGELPPSDFEEDE